ncbi:MAG: DUF4124 domain-containing protein [Gammaproteobacteria bacterium]|nr:DUF4124 domain-containing protein [Gammaproteobacteria bacterium]
MPKTLRLLLLLLLLAVLFPFLYPWKDGKPLLSWSDLKAPKMPNLSLPELPRIMPETDERQPHQPVTIYRWQDEEGTVQFSNETPAKGVAYEVVEVNPDANLIQAPVAVTSNTAPPDSSEATTPTLPSPLTASPGEALQLLEDARKVQGLSDERLRRHEALTR